MNGSIVIDASIVFKWVVEEEYTAESRDMLVDWRSNRTRMLAPALLMSEVANALYQRIRRGELTLAETQQLLRTVQISGIEILDHDPQIHTRALKLAHHFSLRATYDAHYLALAESLDCEMWTTDERLWNSVRAAVGWVRWIGEPSPNSA